MAIRSLLISLLLGLAACGDDSGPTADGGRPDSTVVVRCDSADDPDEDYISRADDGEGDADGDTRPNWDDVDADGDTHLDAAEAGDADCLSPPVDTDRDTLPDFLDTDGNGDGISDADQNGDTDGDGRADWQDFDVDGDGLDNAIEFGPGPTAADTDGDTMPDVLDTDSDNDTILDAHEGDRDPDRDMIPAFRDLDSDGDGIDDAVEAGDSDPLTPPFQCAAEIDPVTEDVRPDGLVDALDIDRDNDGVSDRDETRAGSGLCDIDSDDDGFSDIVEVAYGQVNCPDGTSGTGCTCVTDPSCGIPPDDYFLVLPYMGEPQERELDFGTEIRVADVFFLTDTTGSMGGTLDNVKRTVATPGTGLVDRIAETISSVWVGGGQFDDEGCCGYGGGADVAFGLAIGSTDISTDMGRMMVQTSFNAIPLHGGGDGPESGSHALFEVVTGMGGTWTGAGAMWSVPNYAADCLDTGWGAPCFRNSAMPIIVLFTDICQHNGPPGEDPSCTPHAGIAPAVPTWEEAVAEMNRVGAKFIGINASSFSGSCSTVVGAAGYSPCYFLKRTAEETGSVDLDGSALVYDLPTTASSSEFADTIVGAVETLATRVPLDVTTALRDDASDPFAVDATRFVKRRRPACTGAPGDDACWMEAAGVSHDQAVAAIDSSTFFGVIPGTRVLFDITFQNDFEMGGEEIRIFIAYIDVTAGGSAVLDTREVYIVVPPFSIPIE